MKAYGGVEVWIDISLTSAIARGEWSASHPGCFITGERARVDPRASLEDVEKRKFFTLPGLEI
jgi:hypothetical protein